VLQAQREAAVRTGSFLDLTAEADVSDEALETIRAEVEAHDDEAGAERRATAAQERQQTCVQELVRVTTFSRS
jgi:hypothetical protein